MITGILLIIFGLKIYDNLDNKIKEIEKINDKCKRFD